MTPDRRAVVGLGVLLTAAGCFTEEPDPPATGIVGNGGSEPSLEAQGGSQSSAATPEPEQCNNGLDDDGNELIDCADPACMESYRCVPVAPAGWSGPTIMYRGEDDPPLCPSAWHIFQLTGGADFAAPPADCACTCKQPTDVVCSYSAAFFPVSNCQGPPPLSTVSSAGCMQFNSPPASFEIGTGGPDGVCTGTAVAKTTLPDAGFTNKAKVCSSEETFGRGCSEDDEVCVPIADTKSWPWQCITHPGETTCPSGAYSERHLVYDSFTDTRDCSACSCEPGDDWGNCHIAVIDGNCNDPPLFLASGPSECIDATNFSTLSIAQVAYPVDNGTCGVSAMSAPIGEATPADPVTVCCLPPP